MPWTTSDLCDAHEDLLESGLLQIVQGRWIALGAPAGFCGRARTLRVFEDNSLVARALKEPGQGCVLVVDAGASLRRAVVGGNLARAAADNGWSGLLVHGAVRDADEIDAAPIGVRALGLCPRRSVKRGQGQCEVAVTFGGVTIAPAAWIYADRDAILVAAERLHAP